MPRSDAAIEFLPNLHFTRFDEDSITEQTDTEGLLSESQRKASPADSNTEHEMSSQQHVLFPSTTEIEATPLPLQYTSWRWCRIIAINLALCSMTIPFFVLAVTNAMLDSQKFNQVHFDKIQKVLATTVFPLVFAAVVGRAIMKGASWELEKGTRLETLEQLVGSRTVFGTYQTHVSLRSFNFLSLGLILLWAMSPLGGQSTSRILSTGIHSWSSSTVVQCIETLGALNLESGTQVGDYGPLVSTMLYGALSAGTSIKRSNLDPLGNVKIPYLLNSKLSWSNYTSYMDASLYSSLIGIPVLGLQPGNTTFSIESTHIQLNCTTLREQQTSLFADSEIALTEPIPSNYTWLLPPNGTYSGFNGTNISSGVPDTLWSLGLNQFPQYYDRFWYQVPNKTGLRSPTFLKDRIIPPYNEKVHIEFNRSALIYQDKSLGPTYLSHQSNGTFAQCDILQSYVESQLLCEVVNSVQNCSVVAQRQSRMPHVNPNLTWFHLDFVSFSQNLPRITTLKTNTYDIIQLYINRGDTELMFSLDDLPALSVMDPVLFGRRLGQIINAYAIGNIVPYAYVGGPGDTNRASRNTEETFMGTPVYQNITGILTEVQEVYVCSWPWFVVLLSSTLVMFSMAILGTYYDLQKHTPDILGYCSLLTRDAKYVSVAPGGNLLDGLDRTKRFKDLRLRFGDIIMDTKTAIGSDDDRKVPAGHLAVGNEDKTTRARKGQLYM
ncbi:hypothetical protein CJF32_00006174 [Rutstroemia sp. NJR-2017a WRK4]|nr:hypothetical protein CJF32_00006174 [Rutstroemia sp. NJR-2017a WRK4]